MNRNLALYQVGLKVILKKGEEYLFLTDTATGRLDFPGGRINDDEYDVPLQAVVEREVREELGEDLKYELGKPVFQYRARFHDEGPFVFITVYEATYLSGTIRLSSEHSAFRWADKTADILAKENFFNNEIYFALKKYFDNI
jgi:8-oxo-dGTP pyrophosphatase MutT (NUDIX family)